MNVLTTLPGTREFQHERIQQHIDEVIDINKWKPSRHELKSISNDHEFIKRLSRRKVIYAQLHCATREGLAELQRVKTSVYNEIEPLHLPEVLALIGRRLDRTEMYKALSENILSLISTSNLQKYIKIIKQQMEHHTSMIAEHAAKLEELKEQLSKMENLADERKHSNNNEYHNGKRRRIA